MIGRLRADPVRTLAAVDLREVLEILAQLVGDLLGRRDEVHQAGADGAAHHAVILGPLLGDGEAAMLLDRPQAECAVAAGAGQDYASRVLALGLGEGEEEAVDGCAEAALRDWFGSLQ